MMRIGPESGFEVESVLIRSEADVVLCRKRMRLLAESMGFGLSDVTRIVTSSSELARNVFVHAGGGNMSWAVISENGKSGVELVFTDQGPGIADIERAMEPGFTTARSLGMGLPGVRRLMDEMDILSRPGAGTVVKVRKWLKVK